MQTRKGHLALEWIIMSSILAIGLIAAAATVRDSLTVETAQAGSAAGMLNQNYTVPEVTLGTDRAGNTYTISGSTFAGNSVTTIKFN